MFSLHALRAHGKLSVAQSDHFADHSAVSCAPPPSPPPPQKKKKKPLFFGLSVICRLTLLPNQLSFPFQLCPDSFVGRPLGDKKLPVKLLTELLRTICRVFPDNSPAFAVLLLRQTALFVHKTRTACHRRPTCHWNCRASCMVRVNDRST